jgi:hypothetical protein
MLDKRRLFGNVVMLLQLLCTDVLEIMANADFLHVDHVSKMCTIIVGGLLCPHHVTMMVSVYGSTQLLTTSIQRSFLFAHCIVQHSRVSHCQRQVATVQVMGSVVAQPLKDRHVVPR